MAEYIKRTDVLAQIAIADYFRDSNYYDGECLIFEEDLIKRICDIPAADVRPVVRARWNTVKYPLYECSNCGAVYQDVGYGFNFCPNCGADMRGEGDA